MEQREKSWRDERDLNKKKMQRGADGPLKQQAGDTKAVCVAWGKLITG